MSMNRNEEYGLTDRDTAPVSSISRHVIEDLVTNSLDNAPQMIDTSTPLRSGLRARFGVGSGIQQQRHDVTERRRVVQLDTASAAQRLIRFQTETELAETELQAERMQIESAETELRAERLAITRLQMATERAELEARKAAAEETLASSRQRSYDLSRRTSTPSQKSPRSDPDSPRVRSPSPTAGMAAMLQIFERRDEQRREDERRREDQRREERREERREDRREAAEREARLEARLSQAPQVALPNPSSVSSDPGFKSNKSFDVVPCFSGADGQPLRPWVDEFLAQADVVGTAHDNVRELRLKLRDPARSHFSRRHPANASEVPELLDAIAYLSSEFGPKYEEAQLVSDYYRLQRKRGSSGPDFKRALTAARQRMRAAGIPAVRDEAEDHYYVLEWCLTATQRTLFLSQLSTRADASDAYLKSLTGTTAGTRRESFAPALISSPERAEVFRIRLSCIEAFLEYDVGDGGHGGTARAATTTGLPDTPSASPTPDRQHTHGDRDRAAVVLRLQAQHTARAADTTKPPPRYYGTSEKPELQRNAATFAARKASQACFGCTPAQLAAQGAIPHWECKHHGQDASDAERMDRVPGSGSARLSDGPGNQRTPRR